MFGRASNVPVAINPTTNQSPATAGASNVGTTKDRLIVGVDFGTTYSGIVRYNKKSLHERRGLHGTGVAAVYSATPDDIDIIKTWPGGNGILPIKLPKSTPALTNTFSRNHV